MYMRYALLFQQLAVLAFKKRRKEIQNNVTTRPLDLMDDKSRQIETGTADEDAQSCIFTLLVARSRERVEDRNLIS